MPIQKKNTKPDESVAEVEIKTETAVIAEIEEIAEKEKKKDKPTVYKNKSKSKYELTDEILVRNGSSGKLFYSSKKQNGYEIVWEEFGSENYVEYGELIDVRNRYPAFYEKNWWLIEDADVLESLGVAKYYQNILKIEDFEALFYDTPEDIIAKITPLSDGLKTTIANRAHELYYEDKIDSRKVMDALEKATGKEIIER